MSRVYLIRHGQAGTRQVYDALSELGRRQARLLGEYFTGQGVRFDLAISGELNRQRQTAAEVCPDAEVLVDPDWNEFDLDHVYRELAPVLCEEDAEFREAYEQMHADLASAGHDDPAGVHRRWTPSDLKVVRAWLQGHPRFRGETWLQFHDRIAGRRTAIEALARDSDDHNIAVFTSATPIGIWAALCLDVADDRAMRLVGAVHNASYTVFRLLPGPLRLHTFNAVPHLTEAALRTYR